MNKKLKKIIEQFDDLMEDLEKVPPLIFSNKNQELDYLNMRLNGLKDVRDNLKKVLKTSEKIFPLILKIEEKIINEVYEDLLLDIHKIKEVLKS